MLPDKIAGYVAIITHIVALPRNALNESAQFFKYTTFLYQISRKLFSNTYFFK